MCIFYKIHCEKTNKTWKKTAREREVTLIKNAYWCAGQTRTQEAKIIVCENMKRRRISQNNDVYKEKGEKTEKLQGLEKKSVEQLEKVIVDIQRMWRMEERGRESEMGCCVILKAWGI